MVEGGKTEAQRHLLSRAQRCETRQRYLFTKPMPTVAIDVKLVEATLEWAQALP